jgi:hypothetical protein
VRIELKLKNKDDNSKTGIDEFINVFVKIVNKTMKRITCG